MTTGIIWFRQDLRLDDNPAFIEACHACDTLIPLYIYDLKTSILGQAQAWWLHHSLIALEAALKKRGLPLVLRKGEALPTLLKLIEKYHIDAVFWNRTYEPVSIARDTHIESTLVDRNITVKHFNGSLLNEPCNIYNKTGGYFKVFTPYWKACVQQVSIPAYKKIITYPKAIAVDSDALDSWQLLPQCNWAAQFKNYWEPGEKGASKKLVLFIDQHLKSYKHDRDFPAKNATSGLSPHLHFGEISPQTIWRAIQEAQLNRGCDIPSAEHFLSELGWREFSTYLLYHFPRLPIDNFRPEFNAFPWVEDSHALQCWQKGRTGYPIVDAGMRELWATGYMHNRVRMIVASFLIKDLLIDWRVGADWFLDTLVDADLANNSASWQWVAGCGADATPYFRIFNPILQSQKFDPSGRYIRKWIPELSQYSDKDIHTPWMAKHPHNQGMHDYPPPIIDHHATRERALSYYKKLRKEL